MGRVNSYFLSIKCKNESCRFCDTSRQECGILKDTSTYQIKCPFFKPKEKVR